MSPNEYEMLSHQMNKGFLGVHKRVDALRNDFKECKGRQTTLFERVSEVEKQHAIDKAIEDQEEKKEGKKWDVWKIIIRASIVGSVSLLVSILGFLIWLSQNIKAL